jgi:hypothetical protein
LVQLALCEEKAFCALEVLLSPRTALCAAFYASHGFLLFVWGDNAVRPREKYTCNATGLSPVVLVAGRPR